MALADTNKSTGMPTPLGGAAPIPLSVWHVAHADAGDTAATSAELLHPFSEASSNVSWLKVPAYATRMYIRGRTTSTLATVTTNPVVRIYGASLDPADSASTATTTKVMRLDNVDANAAGVTLVFVASRAGMLNDGTNYYTNYLPSSLGWTSGYPTNGCAYVAVLVETAANLVTDVAHAIEVMFLS